MKSAFALAAVIVSSIPALASPAFAQEAAVEAESTAARPGSIGVQLDMLPIGSITAKGNGREVSTDTAGAFAIGGIVGYDLSPNFNIGAAPRLVLGVKGEDASSSAQELDVRVRATVKGNVAPSAQLFAFLSPGYSFVMPDEGENAEGFVIAFGAGASYDVSPQFYLSAELGYQLGFQAVEVQGREIDVNFDYLHIGLGAGTHF